MHYEEDGKKIIFRKGEKNMKSKVESQVKPSKTEKKKTTLSVYTYMNWKRFGVSIAIDDGIKINILWFETNIKFEKK